MSKIIVYFFNVFLNACENTTDDLVNISPLIEQCNMASPKSIRVVYKYTDAEKSFKDAASVIIQNICLRYRDDRIFPKHAIYLLASIFRGNVTDKTVRAKLMLLIHVSKAGDIDVDEFVKFIKDIDKLVVVEELHDDLVQWHSAARNVMKHSELNNIIEDAIRGYGFTLNTNVVNDCLDIVFVSKISNSVRGFSGGNQIYINVDHFLAKKNEKIDSVELIRLLKLDFMTVVLHEYSHVKFRKICNDVNLSSPSLAKDKNLGEDYWEFGRLIEKRVFSKGVDWIGSWEELVDKTYVHRLIDSIESNHGFPTPPVRGLVSRGKPLLMGIDCSYVRDMF